MGKLHDWLKKNGLEKLKVSTFFLEAEVSAEEPHKEAAWKLFVDLVTRVSVQELPDEDGVEARALESIHEAFINAREILKSDGRLATKFALTTVYTMNKVMRPFLAEWHKKKKDGAFDDPQACRVFREALRELQQELRVCAVCLGDAAGIDPEQVERLI